MATRPLRGRTNTSSNAKHFLPNPRVKSGRPQDADHWRFPRDTGRADIETALRGTVDGHEGVERVASMGRYATCGRVCFIDNNAMWDFIKANKRKMFVFDGALNALWLTVE